MVRAREKVQIPVPGDSPQECPGLLRSRQRVGVACQDQDRHARGDTGDGLDRGDLIKVGQEDGTDRRSPA